MATFALNRRARRAVAARRRCSINKGVPGGRIALVSFETGPADRDNRTVYRHMGRGYADRRTTVDLMQIMAG